MSFDLIGAGAFLDAMPEGMPWIIEPLLMEGSSMMLYGRQKVGKSSAVTQLFDSLLTGNPWMAFPVRKTGPVIYLQLDMAVMELRRLLERGEAAGYRLRDGLYIPQLGDGTHRAEFNILNPKDEAKLRGWCDAIRPVAVVVDTINDAYEGENKNGDVNAFIRQIHKKFTLAIGDAALVFINHKRKQVQNFKGEEMDDADGFLGGSAWGGVATSILELRRRKGDPKVYLELRDLRLDTMPTDSIPLVKNDLGFFEPVFDSGTMLKFWPECLPPAERDKAVAGCKSLNDVFRDVAGRTGESFEAIKKRYQRASDVDFPWKERLKAAAANAQALKAA